MPACLFGCVQVFWVADALLGQFRSDTGSNSAIDESQTTIYLRIPYGNAMISGIGGSKSDWIFPPVNHPSLVQSVILPTFTSGFMKTI